MRTGVTRARDPAAAVRRALRDDPRVIELADGRLARVDQALTGVALTTRVTRDAWELGALDVDGDLAPLTLLGLDRVALPPGIPRSWQPSSTLRGQMVGISKSLAVIKTLKLTLNGHDDFADSSKKNLNGKETRRSTEDR